MDRAASSYLTGITVKISEKYRPPRKPTLPAGLSIVDPPAHLFSDNFECIDEVSALNLVKTLQRTKKEEISSRKQRIADFESRIAVEKEEKSDEKHTGESTCTSNKSEISASDPINAAKVMPLTQNGHASVLNHTAMPVLTPIQTSTIEEIQKTKPSSINLAEFESFSTNPFEEMELKTLNDKAELALLLQPTPQPALPSQPTQPTQAAFGIPYSTYSSGGIQQWAQPADTTLHHVQHSMPYSSISSHWNYMNSSQPFQHETVEDRFGRMSLNQDFGPLQGNNASNPTSSQGILRQAKSVPDLTEKGGLSQGWEPTNLAGESFVTVYPDKRLSSRTPPPRLNSDAIAKPMPRSILNVEVTAEKNLKPQEKLLVRQLSDMGFPRDLSARIITRIGAKEKDVLDQLLVIQKLEDKGYSRKRIESILERFQPCEDVFKMLEEHLRLSEQLAALGFEEKKIDSALMAAKHDRDKALDILLSV